MATALLSQNVKAGGNSVGNTFDLTPGFNTKFGIIWYSGRMESVDTITSISLRSGVCFFDSATSRRLGAQHDEDGADPMDADSKFKDDCVVLELTAGGTEGGLLDISAIGSTTITFIIDAAFTNDIRFHFWGTDQPTNTHIADRLSPTATGAETCTGTNGSSSPSTAIDFTGAIIFYIGVGQTSSINSLSADSRFIFGWAISGTVQGLVAGGQDDGAMSSDTFRYGNDQECFCIPNATTGFVGRADFDQFNTDGWQMNWAAVPATQRRYCYALVKGGQWAGGNGLTQTNTTTDITLVTTGFTPTGLFLISHATSESTPGTTQTFHITSVGGATSATARACQALFSEDAFVTADTRSGVEYDELYLQLQSGNNAPGALMDVKTWADPIILIMDTAAGTQSWFSYFIHGDAAAGGAAPARRLPLLGVGMVITGGLKMLFDFRDGRRWWKWVTSLISIPLVWFER